MTAFQELLTAVNLRSKKNLWPIGRKGRMSEDERASTLAQMKWSKDISAIKGADIVIEAVIENLEVKKALYAEAETLIAEDSWLCTNTSSLSIAALSSELRHPQRFGGLHFSTQHR